MQSTDLKVSYYVKEKIGGPSRDSDALVIEYRRRLVFIAEQ